MIKGENVRELLINGFIKFPKNIIGKIIKTITLEDKNDCIQVLDLNNINRFQEGYSAYIFESEDIPNNIEEYLITNKITYLVNVKKATTLCDYDVVEISERSGIINILYRSDSDDNILLMTNHCNSNCIFCPESELSRNRPENIDINRLKKIIELIPSDTRFLCITGGEPTLLKENLFDLLNICKNKFEKTDFTVLSNGRMFYYKNYAVEYAKSRPNETIIAIALHGNNSEIHDLSTNSKGSFLQTIIGLKNLHELGEKIEIRIVVNKLNYKVLPEIAKMIVNNFPNVFRVNLMALEMLGNAAKNKDEVWVDLNEVTEYVKEATLKLLKNSIKTYLYNFPLCYVDNTLWQIALPSISDYKVRYAEGCKECKIKSICGGFFESTYKLGSVNIKPI